MNLTQLLCNEDIEPEPAVQMYNLTELYEKMMCPRRRFRRTTPPDEAKYMNQIFEKTQNPSIVQRIEIAEVLGIDPKKVQIWFQNRRAKETHNRRLMEKTRCKMNVSQLVA